MRTALFKSLSPEYSRLRSLAKAAGKRLQAKGFKGAPDFPLVKDVSNVTELRRQIARVEKWLASPTHTVAGARRYEEERKERRRQQNREAQQRHRERMRSLTAHEKSQLARYRAEGYTKINAGNIKQILALDVKQRRLIKAAGTLGYNIGLQDVRQLAQYLEYRYSQTVHDDRYVFDKWVDDFMSMKEKKMSVSTLKKDFEQFKEEQAALLERSGGTEGYKKEDFDTAFSEMIAQFTKPASKPKKEGT